MASKLSLLVINLLNAGKMGLKMKNEMKNDVVPMRKAANKSYKIVFFLFSFLKM